MQKKSDLLTQQRSLELEKSEDLYRGLMDAIPDAIIVVNEHGIIELNNNAAVGLFGYSAVELSGLNIIKLLINANSYQRACQEDLSSRVTLCNDSKMTGMYHAIRKNGTEIPVDVSCSCSSLISGNGNLNIWVIRDISEKIQIERVLQTIAEGTLHYTGNDFFQALVKQLANTLGVRYAFVGELADKALKKIRTLAVWTENRVVDNFEYGLQDTPCENVLGKVACVYQRNVQQLFPLDQLLVDMEVESYAGVPLFDRSGVPLGIIAILDDKPLKDELIIKSIISNFAVRAGVELERIQIERKLHQAATVFENSDEGFMISDAQNNIVAINRAFSKITGYSEAEVLGRNPSLLQSRKQDRYFYFDIWNSIKTSGKWQGEIWNRRKNGEIYPQWLTISVIRDEKETIINYVGVFSDISKRLKAEAKQHELQRQLQHAQKIEALGQLTGGIAHDFNNMLSCILGYTDLAKNLNVKDVQGKLSTYLDQVSHAGERAKELILQLQIFSRNSDHEEKYLLLLEPVVNDAVKMLRPILPSSIEINVNFHDKIPMIHADPVQLNQLIMNLCINARDAMNDKGKINISISMALAVDTKCSSCHQSISGDFVRIIVSDTGTGILKKNIKHLFEPFFTTKDVDKGSGMGLAMVHGIMHDHCGHILIDSKLNEGTEFHLLLPFTPCEEIVESKPEERISQLISGNRQRILIVDDEEAIACFIEEVLEIYDYKISVFTDSEKAFASFLEDPDQYDLVISDQTMPNMTGEEMVLSMLKIQPQLPIILCTGYSNVMNKDRAEVIGVKAFMEKPLKLNDLVQTVNELLAN